MNNIALVTRREYITRVKKKSFLIMTILGPLLIAAFYGVIIWLAVNENTDKELKLVEVIDPSGVFSEGIPGNDTWKYAVRRDSSASDEEAGYFGRLTIPEDYTIDKNLNARFISKKSLSIQNEENMRNHLNEVVRRMKLQRAGLRDETLDSLKTNIHIATAKDTGAELKENNTIVNSGAGFIGAFLIYIFIFLYGVQVMKGVSEEKQNRIVEVIISTIRPFELMMGKILGIALVGLTQILIWVVLSGALITVVSTVVSMDSQSVEMAGQALPQGGTGELVKQAESGGKSEQFLTALFNLNFPLLIGSFLFYFVTGYLLYSALFAAIAAAVDSETDTQQFMFPVTIPLVFALVVAQSVVIQDPTGTLARWLSIIPFTSPIVMMVRIPFGVESWELILSMICMIFGFIGVTWLAAKIYSIGILMYGKKASYRELWRWLFYKG